MEAIIAIVVVFYAFRILGNIFSGENRRERNVSSDKKHRSKRTRKCTYCYGTGEDPRLAGRGNSRCPECGGKGHR